MPSVFCIFCLIVSVADPCFEFRRPPPPSPVIERTPPSPLPPMSRGGLGRDRRSTIGMSSILWHGNIAACSDLVPLCMRWLCARMYVLSSTVWLSVWGSFIVSTTARCYCIAAIYTVLARLQALPLMVLENVINADSMGNIIRLSSRVEMNTTFVPITSMHLLFFGFDAMRSSVSGALILVTTDL